MRTLFNRVYAAPMRRSYPSTDEESETLRP